MRILLAIDGSMSSDRARDLVAGIGWPEGSEVRAVMALEPGVDLVGVPWMGVPVPDRSGIEESLVRQAETALEAAERAIARDGLSVSTIVLRGRPASAIVEEAKGFGADLVVLGNRGHGPFETMLLGSVSAEVVDQAPCPVLVARGAGLTTLIYADDGSEGAEEAGELLADWPIFRGLRAVVAGIADVAIPWSAGMAPGLYEAVLESYDETVREARSEVVALVDTSADRLADAGLVTDVEVREGDPAAAIVAIARERSADLIVMGTRGHTGLSRLLLGSVARNVLLHAPCSVLVVRRRPVGDAPGR